jgi:hypothetical protein
MGQMGQFEGETNLADWRTADGLTMPYKHQNKQNGSETSNAEFKKIELNPARSIPNFSPSPRRPRQKSNKTSGVSHEAAHNSLRL